MLSAFVNGGLLVTNLSEMTTFRSRTGYTQCAELLDLLQLRQGFSPEHLILWEWQRWQLYSRKC